jgi:hypothetical protein
VQELLSCTYMYNFVRLDYSGFRYAEQNSVFYISKKTNY